MPHIAAIIPTFNRKKYLETLLKQLNDQQLSEEVSLSIVVIVDGSIDGTVEMLSDKFPQIHVVLGDGSWWFTKSINQGIKYAEQVLNIEYIIILNDDVEIQNDYIAKLIVSLKNVKKNSLMGSLSISKEKPHRVTFSGVKNILWWRVKLVRYLPPFHKTNLENLKGIYPTMTLNGRGTIIPIELMRKLNYFDEKMFPQYGSDDDLALRALKNNINVYISYDARIFHHIDTTSAGTAYIRSPFSIFLKSFFQWNSVNYILKFLRFNYRHGIKILTPITLIIFLIGTSNAFLFKYRRNTNV